MSLLLSNYTSNGSSKTDEYGTLFGLADLISAGVIKGLAVVANSTPAMNIYVQTGSAAIGTGTAPANYSYFVKNDTSGQGQQVTIGTAAASPRIDYIVLYVDKSVAGSTAVTNNTNSVVKLADVQGTPAGSPSVPSVGQIQAAIGATNPYLILAQIAVGASVSQITNANITDLRSFAKLVYQNIDPSATPRFRAYRNAAANTGSGSMATVVFDTKNFDVGTVFNTSTGTFTAPIAGYYEVKWRLKWVTSGSEQVQSVLVKNGSTTVTSGDNNTTGGTAHATTRGADLVQLAANDTLIVQCSSSGGARSLETASPNCYFSVSLVAV